MCNYEALSKILSQENGLIKKIDFSELREILSELPPESDFRSWWDNDGITEQSKAWLYNRFIVKKVVPKFYVEFEKIPLTLAEVREEIDSEWVPGGKTKDMNDKFVEDSVSNVPSSQSKSSSSSDEKNGCKVAGWAILILDFIIGIPLLIYYIEKFEIESAIGVFIVGFIVFIIAIVCLCIAYPGGGAGSCYYRGGYSSYDPLYYEMRNHNRRVEQMLMDNENHRLQEQMYRLTHESEGSLADKFDTRLTNLFRNPWDGIL